MKAIFLDRDGVINKAIVKNGSPYPPESLDKLEILPGVKDALTNLHKNGYYLIIVTNQPDIARGKTSKKTVDEIHQYLMNNFPLKEIISCFHDDDDNCECRKPKPGALIGAAKKYKLDLASCYMIGDRWRDIEAGISAGCKTIFLDYGYSEKQPETINFRVRSLFEASKIILGEINNELK
jgi:D-glycero-D-manno-heptose 1,7-bisphosphate phosphatase